MILMLLLGLSIYQLYDGITFLPAQDEYAPSPDEQKVFEHYPPMGFPDMIRACIFIGKLLKLMML